MLKRRHGDRSEWKRIIKRQYSQKYIDRDGFKGYVTLLNIHKVTEPLTVHYEGKSVCIVDDGYMWLQHFPSNEHYSLTTMFDANGEVVQWYVDITNENGLENDLPYMDDLFLDIIVLSSGEVIQKDADELEEALISGMINQAQYQLAWAEAEKINQQIKNNDFPLMELAKSHLRILLEEYMDIVIRQERQEDYSKTEDVVKRAFEQAEFSDKKEHFLVQKLRKSDAFIPELSLVAIDEKKEIVGHLLLTSIKIVNQEEENASLALAPVSVAPEFQSKGIGSTLLREAIRRARDLGYTSIIVLGHKDYYPKFGFKRADLWNISAPFPVPAEIFMAIELTEGSLQHVQGTVVYPKEFKE